MLTFALLIRSVGRSSVWLVVVVVVAVVVVWFGALSHYL